MRGDIVIVRAYGNKPVIKRVWKDEEAVVYITNDLHYERMSKGFEGPPPIGFPREDVFIADEKSLKLISNINDLDWSKLMPY